MSNCLTEAAGIIAATEHTHTHTHIQKGMKWHGNGTWAFACPCPEESDGGMEWNISIRIPIPLHKCGGDGTLGRVARHSNTNNSNSSNKKTMLRKREKRNTKISFIVFFPEREKFVVRLHTTTKNAKKCHKTKFVSQWDSANWPTLPPRPKPHRMKMNKIKSN